MAAAKPIVPFGDPILRKRAKPLDGITPRTLRLLDELAATLYAAEGRAGLAAPQIGVLRRAAVLDCGDGLIELINPEMIERSGEQTGAEACLSFPGYYGTVSRSNAVKVATLNRQGERIVLEAEGYAARCMQHEIDHLDGVLFIDHVRDKWLYHEETKLKVNVLDVIRLANGGGTAGPF